MREFFFDVWPADDIAGTALGELTQAFDRQIRAVDQAIGTGQFTINRHDSQFTDGWCAQDNLVRVRLEAGGPFAYDDPRYVFAFFIEEGSDQAVSEDEEGGETATRGGRDAVSILRRAVIYPTAQHPDDGKKWAQVPKTGNVVLTNLGPGEAMRVFLRNAVLRSPNPLAPSSHDFSVVNDSSGDPWADTDTDWSFPVGKDYLTLLSDFVSGGVFFRMGPDLVLHCYEDHPGTDLSGSITFAKGVDVREAAEKQVHASEAMSRAIVKGSRKNNTLQFQEVVDSGLEASIGRREGSVEYKSVSTTARLIRAGQTAIAKARRQYDGPTTAGVLELAGKVPFIDFTTGDSVTVNIPGVYDSAVVRVAAIVLDETETGEYDPTVEFEASPFDPSTVDGFTETGNTSSGKNPNCGDCPEPEPFVPDMGGTSSVYAVLYGPTNRPDRLAYPAVVWYGDGDAPPAGYASAPKTGPVEYVDRTVGGVTSRWALRATAEMTVDIWYNATMAEVLRGAQTSTFRVMVNGAQVWSRTTSQPCVSLCYFTDSVDEKVLDDYVLHAGDVLSAEAYWSFGGVPVLVPAGTDGGKLEITGTATGATADNEPIQGQYVGEAVNVAAGDTTYATNYPYAQNSLKVFAEGVLLQVTQTSPSAGTFALDAELPAGTRLYLWYQATSGDYLGTGNRPIPGSYNPLIPYSLLGTGGDGTGDHILLDDGVWRSLQAYLDEATGTTDPLDLNTLNTEKPTVTYGTPTDQNLATGTDSDGGGDKTFTNPTNANDGNSGTWASIGSYAAGAGTFTGYLVADLGSAYQVSEVIIHGSTDCDGDPTSMTPHRWTLQASDDGSTWTPITTTDVWVGPPTRTDTMTLVAPSVHRYWRIRWQETNAGLHFSCGCDIYSLIINGASVSGVTWVGAPDTSDGDDATYDQIDLDDSDAFLRTTLLSPARIARSRLLIGFSSAGSKTLELYGASLADYSDEALIATDTFTATGSYTADERVVSIVPGDPRKYYRWKDTGSPENRRTYSWELYEAGAGDILVVDPVTGLPSSVQDALDDIYANAGASTLDELDDVTLTTPAAADRLRYNGSQWVNSTLWWEPMVDGIGEVMLDGLGNIMRHEVPY